MKLRDAQFRSQLREEFENKKKEESEVKFSKSTEQDPHILKIAGVIANARQITVQEVFAEIQEKMAKFHQMKTKAPILYGTIADNIVEDSLFSSFWELDIDIPGAPQFSKIDFKTLRECIRAEHNRFFPLRNVFEKRRHENPKYLFTDDPGDPSFDTHNPKKNKKGSGMYASVTTACATPDGTFVFNIPFMQKLLDWGYLKDVKPTGKKYVCNGGVTRFINGKQQHVELPNEYCYIEFLLMHEYLHYSEGDFYYQKVIPNANPKIINFVGDFRSNYLLVKSGYEQLPMGLFNDKINYDRQFTYREMYDLVKSEFDKFPKEKEQKGTGAPIPINVGDEVRMPNGKRGVVTAAKPDGTFDVEEK